MAVTGLALLTACSDTDGDSDSAASASPSGVTSAPATATPTPSISTDAQAAEKSAVLDAYTAFWAEQVKAYSRGDTKGTDFAQYAAAEAKSSTEADLKDLRSKGIVTTGAPTHEAEVDRLSSAKQVPSAQLTDCLDSTAWKFIYSKTRKPVQMPENRLVRYVTKVDAEKWGKQWKIVNVTPKQDAC
ncbi:MULTISPECIES: hypothetical protein [unclassified Streptomyces]|uniref:hypothetical protein n=1 Tax=unclassified Streptomyces TaxID=2593676 RepID=UPI0036E1C21F